MIRQPTRARAGITLTEVLISILILGVGMISVASLFPLGLIRIRDANNMSRSTLLTRSAKGEIQGRDLLNNTSFLLSWYGPVYPNGNSNPYLDVNGNVSGYSPWKIDPIGGVSPDTGVARIYGPGLPVMYDPLWWSVSHQSSVSANDPNPVRPDSGVGGVSYNNLARFGQNLNLRVDPYGGLPASSYGLQRITNFLPYFANVKWDFTYPANPANTQILDVAGLVFASQDDPVFQSLREPRTNSTGNQGPSAITSPVVSSPLVPAFDMNNKVQFDWSYTFAFTGQMSDVNDVTVYDGSIVIFHNRAFGLEMKNGAMRPIGERTVEAVFGSSNAPAITDANGNGYGSGDDRLVTIRWPLSEPDPTVAIGSWLADVTYERYQANSDAKFGFQRYPGQRCHWYQVAKRSASENDPDVAGYRRMLITLTAPVRARTLLTSAGGPAYINVAVLNPYIINVFPKVFYSK